MRSNPNAHMKVGVIKLGARIAFNANDTSGANGEARSIINMLDLGGADVHIFTKILAKDTLNKMFVWHDLGKEDYDTKGLDVLLVINGNVNFFGGAEDVSQLLNYKIINEFDGPVFYAYCDPELTLKQVWPSVAKKPWAKNWEREELEIVRNDIIYLSQPYDVLAVAKNFSKSEVKPMSVKHFPFEQFPCLTACSYLAEFADDNGPLKFNPNPEVDLSYGGTMRGGKRIEKMLKFYFGHPDISVEMFGKIDASDFVPCKLGTVPIPYPHFSGPVKYDQMIPKMNKALAHCVIGDPYYEEINDMPQRTYESIMANVVTFIDHDMDKLRRVYGRDKVLADFLYVKDRQELSEKILLLKTDTNLRRQILDDQAKAVNFNAYEYSANFVKELNSAWWRAK